MSALTELIELLTKRAADNAGAGIDKVGREFLDGAARPGTFERGRDFAKTPEGLAAQFDWGTPERFISGRDHLRLSAPEDPTSAAFMFKMPFEDMMKYSEALKKNNDTNGYQPFLDRGDLPKGANYYSFDTGPLTEGSGQGKRAYGALYGNLLNDPLAYNVKDTLTGPNAYRNNYNLGSAIMRAPDAGSRLLASPEQFQHLPVDVAALRHQGPQRQVGSLQTEGALQTLRRLRTAGESQQGSRLGPRLEEAVGRLNSSMSPEDAKRIATMIRELNMRSTAPIGPGALRKLGIVKDSLEGREVNPAAFRRLEFKRGGLAQACDCGLGMPEAR